MSFTNINFQIMRKFDHQMKSNVGTASMLSDRIKLNLFQLMPLKTQHKSPPLHSERFPQHHYWLVFRIDDDVAQCVSLSANGGGEGDLGGEVKPLIFTAKIPVRNIPL